MKAVERTVLVKAVQTAGPELVGWWPLLRLPISDDILRGICFERSSDPEGAYVWAFVQPLYVLRDSISLSYGERLRGPRKLWYPAEAPALAKIVSDDGLSFLRSIATPGQFARWRNVADRDDVNTLEARGCSLLAAGEIIDGVRTLRRIAAQVVHSEGWMRELGERAEAVADAAEQAPAQAAQMLASWSASTRRALKL